MPKSNKEREKAREDVHEEFRERTVDIINDLRERLEKEDYTTEFEKERIELALEKAKLTLKFLNEHNENIDEYINDLSIMIQSIEVLSSRQLNEIREAFDEMSSDVFAMEEMDIDSVEAEQKSCCDFLNWCNTGKDKEDESKKTEEQKARAQNRMIITITALSTLIAGFFSGFWAFLANQNKSTTPNIDPNKPEEAANKIIEYLNTIRKAVQDGLINQKAVWEKFKDIIKENSTSEKTKITIEGQIKAIAILQFMLADVEKSDAFSLDNEEKCNDIKTLYEAYTKSTKTDELDKNLAVYDAAIALRYKDSAGKEQEIPIDIVALFLMLALTKIDRENHQKT